MLLQPQKRCCNWKKILKGDDKWSSHQKKSDAAKKRYCGNSRKGDATGKIGELTFEKVDATKTNRLVWLLLAVMILYNKQMVQNMISGCRIYISAQAKHVFVHCTGTKKGWYSHKKNKDTALTIKRWCNQKQQAIKPQQNQTKQKTMYNWHQKM